MAHNKDNVSFVPRQLLCTSCGVCAGACPKQAIEMTLDRFGIFIPVIDENKCTGCGLCVRVCPGHSFDYAHHYERLHGELPEHVALGNCLHAYLGYTTDEDILRLSQSGGFVSTLLIYCIEKGLIDGAVVTRWQRDDPFGPETYIARTREEILEAVGSKYNPVPAGQILGTILKESGKFAFVGTSCQIQGMRKAEEVFPSLAEKISLYIGLHCLGVFTFHFHDQVLHKLRLKRTSVRYFRHKDKAWRGWPCDMRLKDDQGRVYDLDANQSRLWPRPFFTNWRCQLCFDKANEFSDVSCGDCRIWGEHKFLEKQGYDLKRGLSEIVVRTDRAQQLISQAIQENKFVFRTTNADSIASSIGVSGKKLGYAQFRRVGKLFRVGIPEYGVHFSHPEAERSLKWRLLSPWTFIHSAAYLISFRLLSLPLARWMMKRVPHRILGWLDQKSRKRVYWSALGSSPKITAVPGGNEKHAVQEVSKGASNSLPVYGSSSGMTFVEGFMFRYRSERPIWVRILHRLLRVPRLRLAWSLLKKQVPGEVDLVGSLDRRYLRRCRTPNSRFGNTDQAKLDCLLEHFRTRPLAEFLTPPRLWGRPSEMMRTYAKDILSGLSQENAEIPGFQWLPGEHIDWQHSIGKVQFALQRHVFLLDLLYSDTSNVFDKLHYISQFIVEWRRANMDCTNGNPFAWNDDAVSNRIQVQMRAMEALLAHGQIDWESLADYLKCVVSHGQWLVDDVHYNFKMNHGMMQDCALLEIAVTYAEFDRGQAWRKKCVQRMERRLHQTVLSSGVFLELAPYYHWFAMKMALWFVATCEKHSVRLSPATRTTVKKMVAFYQLILQPDGSLPLISDTKPTAFVADNWPWESLPDWPEISTLRNAMSRDSQPPNGPGVFIFEESGYVIMRQAAPHWSRESALMLTLMAGPKSVCHGHRNKLSITLFARGQSLLEGPGYPGYWDLPAREKLISTPSQNTVSVDGGSQRDGASSITFHRTWPTGTKNDADGAIVVAFQAQSDLYDGVLHRRTVLYGPEPGTILLLDELFSRDEHVYRQHFRPARHLQSTFSDEGAIRIPIEGDEASDHFVIQPTAYRDGDEVTPAIDTEDGVWSFVVRGKNVCFVTVLKTTSESKSTVSLERGHIGWSGKHGTFTISLPVDSKNDIAWQAACD